MIWIGGGVVRQILRPGHWQTASGTGFAKQDVGRRPAALVAWPPHLEHSLHSVYPGQGYWLACVENDHRIWIDGCNVFHELVLLAGQSEDRLQASPEEDDRNLGMPGRVDRRFMIGFALVRRVPA